MNPAKMSENNEANETGAAQQQQPQEYIKLTSAECTLENLVIKEVINYFL